jgi:phosphoglycerol geranylgeranyltransferase
MKVLEYLENNTVHLTLLDPDKQVPEEAGKIAHSAKNGGTDGIMVGGSIGVSQENLDATVESIKEKVNLPVILFPGGVTGISKRADAIFFMSLLNSKNPNFITGAQAVGAPLVKAIAIEPIPMGYIVIEPGGAAGKVGDADLIPRGKPEVAVGYALAAQYLGMRLVYLEAGSGADKHVPEGMISQVKEVVDIPVLVGGGIRSGEDARAVKGAGADIIVTGTIVEQTADVEGKIREITSALK